MATQGPEILFQSDVLWFFILPILGVKFLVENDQVLDWMMVYAWKQHTGACKGHSGATDRNAYRYDDWGAKPIIDTALLLKNKGEG